MSQSLADCFQVVKGWFSETLPGFKPDPSIAVLRLDADWSSSTAECQDTLYPLVPAGGLVIHDNCFAWDGCSRATHDYLSVNALSERIRTDDSRLAYLVKTHMRPLKPIHPERPLA